MNLLPDFGGYAEASAASRRLGRRRGSGPWSRRRGSPATAQTVSFALAVAALVLGLLATHVDLTPVAHSESGQGAGLAQPVVPMFAISTVPGDQMSGSDVTPMDMGAIGLSSAAMPGLLRLTGMARHVGSQAVHWLVDAAGGVAGLSHGASGFGGLGCAGMLAAAAFSLLLLLLLSSELTVREVWRPYRRQRTATRRIRRIARPVARLDVLRL